jgi:hypothetical protein
MAKKKEVIIPEIINNVISKCDDLINQAMERENKRFQSLNTRFQEWFLSKDPNTKFIYGPIIPFLQQISGKYKVSGTVEYYSISHSFPENRKSNVLVYNQESFNGWFNNYKEEYKMNQIWKLTQSMMKHLTDKDSLSSDVRISKTPKGFCVEFQYLNDGQLYNYQTDAIQAGGYNIQCFHYRYITKIKKVTN